MSNIYAVEHNFAYSCQHILLPLGWKNADGIAIATKEYKTAVGIKLAMAYLLPAGPDEYRLSGDYQSQGRNILERFSVYIPRKYTAVELENLVKEFAKDVDEVVAESYAYKLLHMDGHNNSLSDCITSM